MSAPKLRFKEFDQKWGVDALQDQIDFLAGYAFDSKLMSNEPQKYQLIKMSNVYQNQLDLTRNPSYWTNIDSKIEKFLLKKGDIVLTLTGTVGKTDYGYNVEIDKDDKFLLNQRLVRLRAKQDLSDSKFIQYRISTDKFFYHFFYSSKGGTGNQSNVSIEDLKLLELNFPSKEEQTKIAAFLSAVDEKITQLTQKHQLLSQYKQGMMQKLFSQQIRFKADDGSEFGEWQENQLLDLSTKKSSKVTAKDIEDNDGDYIVFGASGHFRNINSYTESEPYIAIVKDGAGAGRLFLMPEKSSVLGTLEIVKPNLNIQLNFLFYRMQLIDFSSYIKGSTIPHVYFKDYSQEKIYLPCLEEQTKIANFLSAIDQKIEVVAQQIEQAKTWKKGLLQQMFI